MGDLSVMIFLFGGERGPVTFPAFKAGDAVLRGPGGGFDFHTLPPDLVSIQRFDFRARERKGTMVMFLWGARAERLFDSPFSNAPAQQSYRYSSSCGYPHGEVIPAELSRLFRIR
jgi:hypothetical protein